MLPQLQPRIDASFDRHQHQFVEPGALAVGELRERELGERFAPTKRERIVECGRRGGRIAVVERPPSLRDEVLEPHDVDVVGRERERVAGIGRDDRSRAERPPQVGDQGLQGICRISRRVVTPQRVDQPLGAHGFAAVERQQRKQGALSAAADRQHGTVVGDCLQLSEQAQFHLMATVRPKSLRDQCLVSGSADGAVTELRSGPDANPRRTT